MAAETELRECSPAVVACWMVSAVRNGHANVPASEPRRCSPRKRSLPGREGILPRIRGPYRRRTA